MLHTLTDCQDSCQIQSYQQATWPCPYVNRMTLAGGSQRRTCLLREVEIFQHALRVSRGVLCSASCLHQHLQQSSEAVSQHSNLQAVMIASMPCGFVAS